MANQQLINYMKQNINSYSVEQLKQSLIQQGYSVEEVEEAARLVTNSEKV